MSGKCAFPTSGPAASASDKEPADNGGAGESGPPAGSIDPSQVTTATKIAWYDGDDHSTKFTDTAGTTPVTAAGQNVRRWNDKFATHSSHDLLERTTDQFGISTAHGVRDRSSDPDVSPADNEVTNLRADWTTNYPGVDFHSFCVFKPRSIASVPMRVIGGYPNNTERHIVEVRTALTYGVYGGNAWGTSGTASTDAVTLEWWRFDSNKLVVRVNGVESAPVSAAATSQYGGLCLFSSISATLRFLGEIRQTCYYSGLVSGSELTNLRSWMDYQRDRKAA